MTVTLDRARATLTAVCETHPDRRNPASCTYTDPTDPTHHCVIGEVMLRLDLPLPPYGADDDEGAQLNRSSYDSVARALDHDVAADAVDLLYSCQSVFDTRLGEVPREQPCTWGEGLAYCRERGLL